MFLKARPLMAIYLLRTPGKGIGRQMHASPGPGIGHLGGASSPSRLHRAQNNLHQPTKRLQRPSATSPANYPTRATFQSCLCLGIFAVRRATAGLPHFPHRDS